MSTKSVSENVREGIDQIKAHLEGLQVLQDELIRKSEMWEERAKAAEQLLEWIDFGYLLASKKIQRASEERGQSPKVWIQERLVEACHPTQSLPVLVEVYEMFDDMAKARGLSMHEFCISVDVTRAFREVFENRHI